MRKVSQTVLMFIELENKLCLKDRKILIERFVKNKSMEEVGKQFNLSKERIRQREDRMISLIDKTFDLII